MKPRSTAPRRAPGLTLIEVLVSMAVVGVLLAVAAPSLTDFMERRRIVAAANEISNLIHYARSEPNLANTKMVLHFDVDPYEKTSCVALVTWAGTDICKCYQTPVCPEGVGAQLLRVYQAENSRGVSFLASADSWGINPKFRIGLSRRQQMMDATGVRVDIKGRRSGAQLRVELNQLGRVRICSPDNSIGGYPSCT